MNKNKVSLMLGFIFVFVLTLNTVFGIQIFDTNTTNSVYKLSEDSSVFNIPFVRLATQRMDLDREIDQVGMFFSGSTIDINSNLKGIPVFYSNDTVRINSDIEYGIVFAQNDVVINSNVEKLILICCNGKVTVGENANIAGNIALYSPELEVNGVVQGNILGAVDKVTLNNVVNGQVKMNVSDMSFGENAKVEQGIEVNTTNTLLTIDESVGEATIDIKTVEKQSFGTYAVNILTAAITNFVTFLIILLFVKKERLKVLADKIENQKVVKNGLLGYFSCIVLICIGIVLITMLTAVGVSAIVFAAAVLVIGTLLKNIIAGTFIVQLVDKKYSENKTKPNNILVAIVTFLMLQILENIPYVGFIFSFIVFIIAVGICVSLIKPNKNVEEKKEPEVIEAK